MTLRTKGLVIAVLHVALVCGLGVRLLVDRATEPRVWADVAPFDPDLPIRGRYVRLQVRVTPRGFEDPGVDREWGSARLSVEDGHLIATRCEPNCGEGVRIGGREGRGQGLWHQDRRMHRPAIQNRRQILQPRPPRDQLSP